MAETYNVEVVRKGAYLDLSAVETELLKNFSGFLEEIVTEFNEKLEPFSKSIKSITINPDKIGTGIHVEFDLAQKVILN